MGGGGSSLAQTYAEFSITPEEEKIGMTIGEDVLQAAMAHGIGSGFAQTEQYDPANCAPGMLCYGQTEPYDPYDLEDCPTGLMC